MNSILLIGGEIILYKPFIRQTDEKNCGAACLTMILKYFGGNISIGKITEMLNTSKNGVNAYKIIEVANSLGLSAKGYRINIDSIENPSLPLIAHVIINNSYEHYIVIYHIDYKKRILTIADPMDKVRKISFDEFRKISSGIVISFELSLKELLPSDKSNYLKIIFDFIPNKRSLVIIGILSFLITILSIIVSFYFEFMIKGIGVKNRIFYIAFIFLDIYIIRNFIELYRNKVLAHFNRLFDGNLTIKVFKSIIALPYSYYRNHTTGDIISRINDLSILKSTISKVMVTLFVDVFIMTFSCIALYIISSKLFLYSVITYLIYILIIFIFKPLLNKHINTLHENHAESMSYMIESINGFETVKGINLSREVLDSFKSKYNKYLGEDYLINKIYINQLFVKDFVTNLSFVVTILIGIMLTMNGSIKLESLITFNMITSYFLEPIKSFLDLSLNIGESKNALSRIIDIISKKEKDGIISRKIKGNIECKNLSYTYNDKDYVLQNLNLKISHGEKIMIVGPSGSGKSTFFKMLMQYYKSPRNQVFIDNIDINDYKNDCIRNNIAYVSQKEMLFTDSVYNNIILNRNVDVNNFIEIEKMCYIEDILKRNNLGFNMLIEENGFNISGGEAQRIILARTLIKKFNILILDEALNQVDVNMERKILTNIFKKFKNKTIIVISHRLANDDLFDKVIEFKKMNEEFT